MSDTDKLYHATRASLLVDEALRALRVASSELTAAFGYPSTEVLQIDRAVQITQVAANVTGEFVRRNR